MPAPPVREAEPAPDPAPAAVQKARAGDRWRLAAVAVLVAGLLAATGAWLGADDDAPAQGTAWRIVGGQVDPGADTAARDRQTERLGGTALVRTAAFDRWLGSLWHGRRLAVTLAVIAAVVAAACGGIAVLADTPVDD